VERRLGAEGREPKRPARGASRPTSSAEARLDQPILRAASKVVASGTAMLNAPTKVVT
jgi:hypothetical protein